MDEMIEFLHKGPLAPLKKWGTKFSIWPTHLVTACCGVELAHAFASGYDGERLGVLNFGMARQTNCIVVEGAITRKMARALKITYEQMPDPKFVIVMGACGIKGGIFWNGYNMVKPFEVVPVKYFAPGCPPTPESLLRCFRSLQKEIDTGEAKNSIVYPEVKKVEEGKKRAKRVPPSPKYVANNPSVIVDMPREEKWAEGKEVVAKLSEILGELCEKIKITGKNRVAIRIKKDNFVEAAKKMLEAGFDHVKSVNVVDVPHENKFIVEYVTSSYLNPEYRSILVTLISEIERSDPVFPSLIEVWPSADYLERELHELFGVWFEGNPWMGRKFLLAPDTPETPLRKDFKLQEEVYAGGE
ncbi:NADH-quinone oxidoreductase, B subunit [Ferroglobus placidus DSM 10642]|uniref:NADH-quinone oxidoreductase, B subunit n=1 Tax=Ferroglobus placidus (strain DSM 10642 / AEDII12DO) TaxID=589924 RepID=D3RZE0_FERPA|nr:NADH-quinone oxidoreductase subunit NuoB [Ferroglobus placidus]ADC65853.1 NADH-quinone oxidoreductase, B subunit [Ferroglobus placidus DSM 10642]